MVRTTPSTDRSLPVGGWSRSDLTGAIHDATVAAGYRPLSVALDRSSFARTLRPRWATVAAIVTSPTLIGLMFLLVRSTETFTAIVREDHTGISVRIHGRVERPLFDELTRICAGPTRPTPAAVAASSPVVVPSQPIVLPGASSAPVLPVPGLVGVAPPPVSQPISLPSPAGPAPVMASMSAPPAPAHAPDPSYASAPPPATPPALPASASSAAVAPATPNPWLLAPAAGSSPGPVPPSTSDLVDGSTQVVSRPLAPNLPAPPTGPTMTIRLEDGRTFDVSTLALLGRNPAPADHDVSPRLVVVDHETVSKTHVAIGITDGVAWVADRYSTNGSVLVDHHGREIPLDPGQRIRVDVGCALRLGAYWARIERFS